MTLHLVTGPNDCGKSAFAEELFAALDGPKHYFATLPPLAIHDARIRRHRLRRPPDWNVTELGLDLDRAERSFAEAIATRANVLLDGLSIYSERLTISRDAAGGMEAVARLEALLSRVAEECPALIIVDNPFAFADLDQPHHTAMARLSARLRERAGRLVEFTIGAPA